MTSNTQEKIACKIGISQGFLNNLLSGKRRPSPQKALQLEKECGINRNVWLYESPAQIRKQLEMMYGKIKRNSRRKVA